MPSFGNGARSSVSSLTPRDEASLAVAMTMLGALFVVFILAKWFMSTRSGCRRCVLRLRGLPLEEEEDHSSMNGGRHPPDGDVDPDLMMREFRTKLDRFTVTIEAELIETNDPALRLKELKETEQSGEREDGPNDIEAQMTVWLPFPGEKTREHFGDDKPKGCRAVSNVCAICLEPFLLTEEVSWSSNAKCKHAFHTCCVAKHYLVQKTSLRCLNPANADKEEAYTCPCCRQPFAA